MTYREGRLFLFCKRRAKALFHARVVLPRFVSAFLFKLRVFRKYFFQYLKCKLYYENILRYRCKSLGSNFMCFGGFRIEGNGAISIGNNVTMFKEVTFLTGGNLCNGAEIRIGDNASIGYRTVFRCEKRITIGSNCLIGGETIIGDNDGHRLNHRRVEKRLPAAEQSVRPVTIEDDVWIGERCIIMKGVTIGRGSIISAGSVVTRSIPPGKIAMGHPARVVMWVPEDEDL